MKTTTNRAFDAALFIVLLLYCAAFPAFFDGSGAWANMAEDAKAQEINAGFSSGLPVPRFVALKSARVYFRRGPSFKHPVDWVFQRKDWPVEVIAEYGPWRQVRDVDGTRGWVHQRLLNGARSVLVAPKDEARAMRPLYSAPVSSQKPRALIEPRSILKLTQCIQRWCEVQSSFQGKKISGFMRADDLWGLYPREIRGQ